MPDIRVQDEQGTIHVFPDGSTPEMIAKAMNVKPPAPLSPQMQMNRALNASPTKFEIERNPDFQEGGVSAALGAAGNMVKGVASTLPPVAAYQAVQNAGEEVKSLKQTGKTIEGRQDEARKAAGYGLPYRAAAQVAGAVGIDAPAMEHNADIGNSRAIVGQAAVPIAAAVAPLAVEGVAKMAPKIAPAVSDATTIRGPQASVMEEAKNLPPKVYRAAEDIFRASAPTGTKIGFRENVYKAVGDLAEIGQKLNLSEAKGGVINPDMRVRATVQAIDEHLGEMYQNERAAQITPHGNDPVKFQPPQDAVDGLKYLSRSAGDNITRNIAGKAASGGQLTLAETDALAQTANQYLKGFESMTAAERQQSAMTNRRMFGLKQLDRSLSETLNSELQAKGEPGLYAYERRYAALSEIKQQLERRMNAVELERTGISNSMPVKAAGSIAKVFTGGGKSGIASASQAAVADVKIGQMLQRGMKALSESGIKPERPTRPNAP